MAIKINARERMQTIGRHAGTYRYVMQAELYNSLNQKKVVQEAAIRSGLAEGTVNAAWAAIGEVVKAWATEGHSVAIPGVGTMRFGVRATSVDDVNLISDNLITSRRVIFTPNVDIKDELARTSINITCYDRNGKVVKQVQSGDSGQVENPEGPQTGGGGGLPDSGGDHGVDPGL